MVGTRALILGATAVLLAIVVAAYLWSKMGGGDDDNGGGGTGGGGTGGGGAGGGGAGGGGAGGLVLSGASPPNDLMNGTYAPVSSWSASDPFYRLASEVYLQADPPAAPAAIAKIPLSCGDTVWAVFSKAAPGGAVALSDSGLVFTAYGSLARSPQGAVTISQGGGVVARVPAGKASPPGCGLSAQGFAPPFQSLNARYSFDRDWTVVPPSSRAQVREVYSGLSGGYQIALVGTSEEGGAPATWLFIPVGSGSGPLAIDLRDSVASLLSSRAGGDSGKYPASLTAVVSGRVIAR